VRRLSLVALLAFAFLFAAAASRADQVQEIQVTAQNYGSASVNPVILSSFDPSLGTLNSVNVSIQGTFSDTILTFPTVDGEGIPVQLPFVVDLSQDFQGFISFLSPTDINVTGLTDGFGDPIQVIGTYDYTFTFDPNTDLIGQAVMSVNVNGGVVGAVAGSVNPIPMPIALGTMADFESPVPGFSIPLVGTESTVVQDESDATAITTPPADQGAIIVQYNYTATIPDQPVPEPPTGLLLLLGMPLLFWGFRLRGKQTLV
jgi:hypothetical protein